MATLTKLQVRTQVQQLIDDPGAKRWTAAALDALIETIHDGLWIDILDAAPYYVSQYQQIALASLHAPGYIDMRQTAVGDLTTRFYRLQQVIADGRQYFAKDPRDYLMTAASSVGLTTITADQGVEQRFTYQFLGPQMWLHPLGQVTTFVELRYNYLPTTFTSLADNAAVDMPEGTYRALTMLSAADAMPKGAAEDSTVFDRKGEEARQRMLNAVRRRQHGSTQIYSPESSVGFGGT